MRFRALTDIFTPGCGYVQAGQILSSTPGPGEIPIPSHWIHPAHAVDPLDPDAVERYWQAGPAGCMDAEWRRALFTNCARWSDVPVAPPSTQWLPVDPTKPWLGFVLSGGGGNYGPKPPMGNRGEIQ